TEPPLNPEPFRSSERSYPKSEAPCSPVRRFRDPAECQFAETVSLRSARLAALLADITRSVRLPLVCSLLHELFGSLRTLDRRLKIAIRRLESGRWAELDTSLRHTSNVPERVAHRRVLGQCGVLRLDPFACGKHVSRLLEEFRALPGELVEHLAPLGGADPRAP